MKIENIPLFIAFFVLILFVVFGQKFLAEYFFAKMSEALSNDDFVSFDKYANNFFSRFLFSPFELNYMKLNAMHRITTTASPMCKQRFQTPFL